MKISIVTLSLLSLALPVMAASPVTPTPSSPVKAFVQSFYDWYVPAASAYQGGFSYELVLKQKPYYFSDALSQALNEDWKAREKEPSYIVGLEFDPILASQDPCDHYVAGTIRQAGKNYEADIFFDSGAQHDKPDVIAELSPQGGSWVFVDFIYPARDGIKKDDLLSLLKRLKSDREKPSK